MLFLMGGLFFILRPFQIETAYEHFELIWTATAGQLHMQVGLTAVALIFFNQTSSIGSRMSDG